MNLDFLSPIQDIVLAHNELQSSQAIGKKLKIHSQQLGIPELEDVKIAIVGVLENRNNLNYLGEELQLHEVRKALYNLFPGNWHYQIADLGDINPGETVEDTYFALQKTVESLINENIIPIIIGGSQDLTYATYRAYDNITSMVNLVNIDYNFDLGDSSKPITNSSYLGKIIMEQPYNLFNYSTIGYQTYFNSQEEIDLMDKLYFEAYRLGEIVNNIHYVEPILRDANFVSIDLSSIQASDVSERQKFSPNGFNGREICAISRYAGISNKVTSFGIYEYKNSKNDQATSSIIAQIIWYFIEGVNCRVDDDDFTNENSFQKFMVLVDEDELIFYKSNKTGRWWIEIPFLPNVDNKLKRHTLLPCMHDDYNDASKGKIPERWYKAYKKNSI